MIVRIPHSTTGLHQSSGRAGLEDDDATAGPEHAMLFAQYPFEVFDVAQQVALGDRVERFVTEGQVGGVGVLPVDGVGFRFVLACASIRSEKSAPVTATVGYSRAASNAITPVPVARSSMRPSAGGAARSATSRHHRAMTADGHDEIHPIVVPGDLLKDPVHLNAFAVGQLVDGHLTYPHGRAAHPSRDSGSGLPRAR